MREVRFKYQRMTGIIRLGTNQRLEVVPVSKEWLSEQDRDWEQTLREIKRWLEGDHVEVRFRHPGIPGTQLTFQNVTEETLLARAHDFAEKFGYWVWEDWASIVGCPWFGTQGFFVLYKNLEFGRTTYVVEDIATGSQAFYSGLNLQCQWFDRLITKSGLIDDWMPLNNFRVNKLSEIQHDV